MQPSLAVQFQLSCQQSEPFFKVFPRHPDGEDVAAAKLSTRKAKSVSSTAVNPLPLRSCIVSSKLPMWSRNAHRASS